MMDRENERVRLKKKDEEREANERKRTVEDVVNGKSRRLPATSLPFLIWKINQTWMLTCSSSLSFAFQMSMWPAFISLHSMHISQNWLTSRPNIWAWIRTGPSSQTTIGKKTAKGKDYGVNIFFIGWFKRGMKQKMSSLSRAWRRLRSKSHTKHFKATKLKTNQKSAFACGDIDMWESLLVLVIFRVRFLFHNTIQVQTESTLTRQQLKD